MLETNDPETAPLSSVNPGCTTGQKWGAVNSKSTSQTILVLRFPGCLQVPSAELTLSAAHGSFMV